MDKEYGGGVRGQGTMRRTRRNEEVMREKER